MWKINRIAFLLLLIPTISLPPAKAVFHNARDDKKLIITKHQRRERNKGRVEKKRSMPNSKKQDVQLDDSTRKRTPRPLPSRPSSTSYNWEPGRRSLSTLKPKSRRRRPGRRSLATMMQGVPKGLENCLNRLAQMAALDPLLDYEGHPSEIINNGLLWNDPKSKCAVSDQSQREKIFELANAWRMKDSAKVRSLLQELGATSSISR